MDPYDYPRHWEADVAQRRRHVHRTGQVVLDALEALLDKEK
jgi:hypothetical protein